MIIFFSSLGLQANCLITRSITRLCSESIPARAEDGISKLAPSTIDRMDRKSQLFFLAIFATATDSISTASALLIFRNFDFSTGEITGFSVEVIWPRIGFSDFRIIVNHILPNILNPIIVISTANFATAILLEAGLSFLGLGIQPPTPSCLCVEP